MALDRVPWFVSTPGVQHSSEVARVLAHAATGGARGVSGSASALRVTQAASPNGTVSVASGVAVAPSNYPGDVGQSYIMRNITSTSVNVVATGSAAGRSDAVIIRVDDVARVGQAPSDPNNYDYTKLQVIQGVSANLKYAVDLNLPYPFVLLARIDIPKSTTVITNAMIKDMRTVVLGREERVVRTFDNFLGGNKQIMTTRQPYPVGQYFPKTSAAEDFSPIHTVRVPEWATEMEIRAEWLSVALKAGSGNGEMWVTYDTVVRNQPAYSTSAFRWSSEDTTQRQSWTVVDTVPVPAAVRGEDLLFALRANRITSTVAGEVWADAATGVVLDIRFLERAD